MNHYLKTRLSLPEELKKDYALSEIILITKSSTLCTVRQKLPMSEPSFVLKIIPRAQYDPVIAQKLSKDSDLHILREVQQYHTKQFTYMIFPKLQTLSYLVKTGKADFPVIRQLSFDLSQTIEALHQKGIFHRDISPGNIYRDSSGHFLLGDFSSAWDSTKKQIPLFHRFLSGKGTGSTPGFYPLPAAGRIPTPASYDIYGLCMILFLLLSDGKPPPPSPASQTTGPFPELERIRQFLIHSMERCRKESIQTEDTSFFRRELTKLFTEVKEEKAPVSIRTTVADFEASLFCSFTEPAIRTLAVWNHIKAIAFSFFQKHPSIAIPKSFCLKEKVTALMICGSIFLLACYHYFSNLPQASTMTLQGQPAELEKSFSAEASGSPDPVIAAHTAAPPYTTAFSHTADPSYTTAPSHTADPSSQKKTRILDISGKNLKDTSFLSETSQPSSISIIFAQKNKFASLSPFFSFSNLKELYLSQNPISAIHRLEQFDQLEILDLSETKLQDVSALATLTHLKLLDLSGQKHLTNLSALKKLKGLEYLILTNTDLSDRTIKNLQKALPGCTILY